MEPKRITVEIDAKTHAAFKSKCAADELTATQVVTTLVQLYLDGRVKVKPSTAKKANP